MSTMTAVDHGPYLAFIAWVLVLVVVCAAAAVLEHVRRPALAVVDEEADTDPVDLLGLATFVCPTCGARSWHPEDRRHGWCSRCKAYTGRPAGLDIPTPTNVPAPTPRRTA